MAGRNPRARGRDMTISMAVLLVPVLAIMAFFARPGDEKVVAVDYQPVLAQARAKAPYEVLAPKNLPEMWVPNRVRWAAAGQPWLNGQPAPANAWQLGFMSPGGVYIAIQQRDGAASSFIAEVTRGARAGESVSINGREWRRYISPDERTKSLVEKQSSATAIVTGDTDFATLEAFAATLSG